MYYVVYGLLFLVSLLPLRVLYFLSDVFHLLFFHVFKYRREVAMKNLAMAFPEKTEQERILIAKKFYRNMTDTLVETIKMLSVSTKWIEKKFIGNWDVLDKLYDSGRSVQLHIGHNFNWEWANAVITKNIRFPFLGVYMPLENKIFNRLMLDLRTRNNTILLKATNMQAEFLKYKDTQFLLGLAADQNPATPTNAIWINFFNQPTAFVTGPERGAKMNNAIVVFAYISKPRRGYYEFKLQVEEENPLQTAQGELTKRFANFLESVIRENPDTWLWTHRRWKHEWKEEYGIN